MKKIGNALPLTEASVLNKFKTYIKMKLTRDIKPPIPSFQSATISAARAITQIIKIMMIRGLKEADKEPLFLFISSIRLAIPKKRVNATRNIPVIRAVHFNAK